MNAHPNRPKRPDELVAAHHVGRLQTPTRESSTKLLANPTRIHRPELGLPTDSGRGKCAAKVKVCRHRANKLSGRCSAESRGGMGGSVMRVRGPRVRAAQVGVAAPAGAPGWARLFAGKQHALFLGRGMHYPIALEGALKLKEISYIHAEAYPAGELKHGPLALVDGDMPVVAVAPNDALLEKLKSNLQEVRARGGELFVLADAGSEIPESEGVHIINMPCLLYTSDAADERSSVDLGGSRIIKKKHTAKHVIDSVRQENKPQHNK